MRKFFSLFLLLFVMILLPISASASELNNSFNLLDYNTPNRVTAAPSGVYNFENLPASPIVVSYFDFVIYSAATPTSAFVDAQYTTFNLSITSIGNNYYRLSASSGSAGISVLKLSVTLNWTNFYTIVSANIMTSSSYIKDTPVQGVLSTAVDTYDLNYTPGNGAATKQFSFAGSYLASEYILLMDFPDWKKFDFIDVHLYFLVDSISSVSAFYGSQSLPCEVSDFSNANTIGGFYYLTVRIDVRNLIPGDSPNLIILGNLVASDSNYVNSWSIISCAGILNTNNFSVWNFYVNEILSMFSVQNNLISSFSDRVASLFSVQNNLISSFSDRVASLFDQYWGGTGAGAAAQDNAAQIKEDLTGGLDAASSFDKPSSSQVNRYLDFNGAISNTAILTSTGFLTAVFDVPLISKVLSLCMLFALAATILFGKR